VDSVDLGDDDGSEEFSPSTGQKPSSSVLSDSFVVLETPSRTIGSNSIHTSEATTHVLDSPSDFRSSDAFGSIQSSDGNLAATSICNVYNTLVSIGNQPNARCLLKIVDLASFSHIKVKYLPCQYNGDSIYELPPIIASKDGAAGWLDGMDRKYDGHAWTETMTTNLSLAKPDISFKYVKCRGHLRCLNKDCPHFLRSKEHNDLYWDGNTPEVIVPGPDPPALSKYTLVCRYCKALSSCLKLCPCKMFYIVPKDLNVTRATVHIGTHEHLVADGDCREAMELIREEIMTQVACTPNAKSSAIRMAVGKELLLKGLLEEHGEAQKLTEDELAQVFDRWAKLGSRSLRNLIAEAWRFCGQGGYIDNILKLKKSSTYDYIHDSKFPGQGDELVYLFKMSTCGQASGVSLVRRMQLGGDLENEWVMFDHVKRVKDWTTLGVHVYDPEYRKVMTIAVCDMQSEKSDAQERVWLSMLTVLEKHGIININFKGFMCDSAQANFNAVRVIFESGDPTVPMANKERTCLFHWKMALERHTKQLIRPDLQAEHIRLCQEYRSCQSLDDANAALASIKAWWFSSGVVSEAGLKELTNWVDFWHFRFDQWRSNLSQVPRSVPNG
jgi:hypothetical protein